MQKIGLFRLIDPVAASTVMRGCAREHALPYFTGERVNVISSKTAIDDLVGIADRETEIALAPALQQLVPGSDVVGEEWAFENSVSYDELARILQNKNATTWVLDPIDGTTNFTNSIPIWAAMSALVFRGKIVAGFIYDVINDVMLFALKGEGCFRMPFDGQRNCWREPERVHVANPRPIETARGFAKPKYFETQMQPLVRDFLAAAAGRTALNATSHEYMRIATGMSDFALYENLRPWDHLAGVLAVHEAGGSVTRWDGTPYRPGDRTGLIVASNSMLAESLRTGIVRAMTSAPRP